VKPLIQPANNAGDADDDDQPFHSQPPATTTDLLPLRKRHFPTTASRALHRERWKCVERGQTTCFLEPWSIGDEAFQTMNLLSEFLGATAEMTWIDCIR